MLIPLKKLAAVADFLEGSCLQLPASRALQATPLQSRLLVEGFSTESLVKM
jgi:hypothetical protein